MLTSQEDGIADMKRRIASRDWWVIPAASQMARDMAIFIEERFYDGDKNDRFHLYMIPCPCDGIPIAAIFFAHKSVMTPAMLAAEVGNAIDDLQDIIITPDTPVVFLRWFAETFDYKSPSKN